MGHTYNINGVDYPSVTTITKQIQNPEPLMIWAKKMTINKLRPKIGLQLTEEDLTAAMTASDEASEKALDVGTAVHNLIEQYIKKNVLLNNVFDTATQEPQVMKAFQAFLDWEKEHKVTWLEAEQTVFNPNDGYAGTADALASIGGKVYMIDFKSSKAIRSDYWLQVAAYRQAMIIIYGEHQVVDYDGKPYTMKLVPQPQIDALGILRLDKETGMPEWETEEKPNQIARYYQAFSMLAGFYYLEKNRRLKMNPWASAIKKAYSEPEATK